jgi:hypothetical protein
MAVGAPCQARRRRAGPEAPIRRESQRTGRPPRGRSPSPARRWRSTLLPHFRTTSRVSCSFDVSLIRVLSGGQPQDSLRTPDLTVRSYERPRSPLGFLLLAGGQHDLDRARLHSRTSTTRSTRETFPGPLFRARVASAAASSLHHRRRCPGAPRNGNAPPSVMAPCNGLPFERLMELPQPCGPGDRASCRCQCPAPGGAQSTTRSPRTERAVAGDPCGTRARRFRPTP